MMRFLTKFLVMLGLVTAMQVTPVAKAEIPMLRSVVFAGGCFWCMEGPFEALEGVESVKSGYAGGHVPNPTYKQVSAGTTGHREVVEVVYQPAAVDFETLLEVYWRNIDPFDDKGQFCDKGFQYSSAIYTSNQNQKELAEQSKQKMEEKLGQPIVTEILDYAEFYPAEDYHQDYYKKNPIRYKFYRGGCKRDNRLEEVWGDEAHADHITGAKH